MSLIDRLRGRSDDDRPDVRGDEPPPEEALYPLADPTKIPPDEGDAQADPEARYR